MIDSQLLTAAGKLYIGLAINWRIMSQINEYDDYNFNNIN